MNDIFKVIAAIDFEYEISAGGLPVVLCLVVYVLDQFLRHVQTIRLWRDDFGSKPPFDIGPDALIVAYSAWAEMTCFLQLGWPFPEHVLDLHTAYLATSNVLEPYDYEETKRKKVSKNLPARQNGDRQRHRRRELAQMGTGNRLSILRGGRSQELRALMRPIARRSPS